VLRSTGQAEAASAGSEAPVPERSSISKDAINAAPHRGGGAISSGDKAANPIEVRFSEVGPFGRSFTQRPHSLSSNMFRFAW